jgi:hypothetical protein
MPHTIPHARFGLYGVHISKIPSEDYSFDYPYDHYQPLWLAAADQVRLLQ